MSSQHDETPSSPEQQSKKSPLDALSPVPPARSDNQKDAAETAKDDSAPLIAPNSEKAEAIDAARSDPFGHDLGWNRDAKDMPSPIIKGLANDDLWLLIRRFNGQIAHVRRSQTLHDKRLDLETVADEEFAPEKLRAHFERLYIQVVVSVMAGLKHVARIASWKETRRSTFFCVAYFVACALDVLMPLIFSTLLVLVLYPPSRSYLFPPAPLAAVSAKTGGLKTPRAGALGSSDSLTGAPEAHKGQAVEQEASNFVTGLGTMAVATVAGKQKPRDSVEDDDLTEEQLKAKEQDHADPTRATESLNAGRAQAQGKSTDDADDKTKVAQQAVWESARPFMRGLEDFIDTYECIGNALTPTPPFGQLPRFKLAGIVVPIFLVSLILPSRYYVKLVELIVGSALFTQPLALKGVHWLNVNYPGWPQALDLRNSILKNVPTNAQLALTLLRLGEEKNAPLPPPPDSVNDARPPSPAPAKKITGDVAVDAHPDEVERESEDAEDGADGASDQTQQSSPPVKKRSKLLGALKGFAKGTVVTAVGVDRVKATAGSQRALQRQGALGGKLAKASDGPVAYAARHRGSRGALVLSMTATTPCVSFERQPDLEHHQPDPKLTYGLEDIQEIKKRGGLGWKSKLVVGTALGMSITDGITLVMKDGKEATFTAMPRRDEFFNRLIAVISTKWDSL